MTLRATFSSIEATAAALAEASYLADEAVATAVFLASALGKPVLAEGPAGTGKTELAKAVVRATGARLVRLQCYEGLDESKALYEWDYRKQLLRLQAGDGRAGTETDRTADRAGGGAAGARTTGGEVAGGEVAGWKAVHGELFGEEFLLSRPLLEAIRAEDLVVLLIDEVDRIEVETEALLLEVLAEGQVSIPELGTVRARRLPFVVLTSNGTRELSEALRRRCLFLPMDYPSVERERAIVLAHVPDLPERLALRVAETVAMLRGLDLEKRPSVAEAIDWARALVLWGMPEIDTARLLADLPVLLKNRADLQVATAHLSALNGGGIS